jgi:hypothetical protein
MKARPQTKSILDVTGGARPPQHAARSQKLYVSHMITISPPLFHGYPALQSQALTALYQASYTPSSHASCFPITKSRIAMRSTVISIRKCASVVQKRCRFENGRPFQRRGRTSLARSEQVCRSKASRIPEALEQAKNMSRLA